ncbi:hypothetical protein ACGFNU_14980 [Spirillospora sp. NPDC048911]|uniref:helix-turn-helix domain-containing protein n=1 Tax=Spirillospora sp. NPDC048911 TaxID=3364527 RepID=UPI0037160580
MAIADEPALTPEKSARLAKKAVIQVGAASGHEAAFAKARQRFGLDRWAFYVGAGAGVLGTVDADVVVAVCGFFAPRLVRPAWDCALSVAAWQALPEPAAAPAAPACLALLRLREHRGSGHLLAVAAEVLTALVPNRRELEQISRHSTGRLAEHRGEDS